MDKTELMTYSWARSFSYSDLLHVAGMITNVEVPTEEEYKAYCEQAYKDMEKSFYDSRTAHERARDELGFRFTEGGFCER